MFYKLLNIKEELITVSNTASFYKYSEVTKSLISTSLEMANRIKIAGKLYKLQESTSPEADAYFVHQITEEEYNELKSQIEDQPPVVSLYLKRTREDKVAELSTVCQQKIIDGCDVTLSVSKQHFKFSIEDQMNITRLMHNVQTFKTNKIIYHSTGNKIEYYSAADFNRIYTAMNNHITYHTTYFNLMKNCIYNMYNINDIKAIKYTSDILSPSDKQLLREIMR